jgi:chemotaxis protein histidine kinase CheA
MNSLENLARVMDAEMDEAEAQLQQELREMFAVDTAQHLSDYFRLVSQLNSSSWTADVQSIYRAVHTIKGGAVTVGAECTLQAATILENLLDDLRYLKVAPDLSDRGLIGILANAGELLSASITIQVDSPQSILHTKERLETIHAQVKSVYLPNWSNNQQLQQEFVEQGFDFVVLPLEMQLDALATDIAVPDKLRLTAAVTISQLQQIGIDLELGRGWTKVLELCQQVVEHVDSYVWKSTLPTYLAMLKDCAANGGELENVAPAPPPVDSSACAFGDRKDNRQAIQIPIPLPKLDLSSQQAAEALLSAKGMIEVSHKFQAQIAQLNLLVDENVQSIARLRQMQDDYAVLRQSTASTAPERYRQGYNTINGLLENILRTAELAQEIETLGNNSLAQFTALERNVSKLRDGIESCRLLPFRTLTTKARSILRNLVERYDKLAEIEVTNEDIELDVGLIHQLEPVLLHLIRNAYDHGIESIEDRIAAGKLAIGTIRITLHRQGHIYILEISDDGAGINAQKLSQKAEAGNFKLIDTSSNSKLLEVLCQPGLTSRETINEVSGRGVGMDVVANQVAEIGATLSLNTVLGQGTAFALQLPVTQLLLPCALLQVADQVVALPIDTITETISIFDDAVKVANGWDVLAGNQRVVAVNLNAYWQQADEQLPESAVAVGIKLPQGISWLIADDLVGQTELLVSPFPKPLVPPAGILGISSTIDGQPIAVLDPAAILNNWQQVSTSALEELRSPLAQPADTSRAWQGKTRILIVDDAALIRRRLESSLDSHGFATQSFGNGMDALNWLQTSEPPALMITDIEMPGMDGYTLIDRCRRLGLNMPILVISSRLSAEWSKEAIRLGANGYLSKGFSTAKLVETVDLLLQPGNI